MVGLSEKSRARSIFAIQYAIDRILRSMGFAIVSFLGHDCTNTFDPLLCELLSGFFRCCNAAL